MPAKKIIRRASVKKTHFLIANFHTGPIVIPQRRKKDQGSVIVRTAPLIIPPGKAVSVEAEFWNDLKDNRGIQNYIDAKIIGVVEREGDVPVSSKSTVSLPIPEHLLRDDEMIQGSSTDAQAKVVRKKVNNIPVE